jgi:hypothetical protein
LRRHGRAGAARAWRQDSGVPTSWAPGPAAGSAPPRHVRAAGAGGQKVSDRDVDLDRQLDQRGRPGTNSVTSTVTLSSAPTPPLTAMCRSTARRRRRRAGQAPSLRPFGGDARRGDLFWLTVTGEVLPGNEAGERVVELTLTPLLRTDVARGRSSRCPGRGRLIGRTGSAVERDVVMTCLTHFMLPPPTAR